MIILTSHGALAKGMKDTVELIVGRQSQLFAFSAYIDGVDSVKEPVKQLISSVEGHQKVTIVTDILGGSVNTEMMSLLQEFQDITLIAGMNLPLIINLLTSPEEDISLILAESKEGIVVVNNLLSQIEEDDL